MHIFWTNRLRNSITYRICRDGVLETDRIAITRGRLDRRAEIVWRIMVFANSMNARVVNIRQISQTDIGMNTP